MVPFEILFTIMIIALYIGIIVFLDRKGILKKYNISLYGPFLMLKTERGKNLIYRLSRRKKLLVWFGNLSIIICFATMIVMVFLLVWQFWWLGEHMTKEVAERLPGVNMVLIIPGINPILPIGYTILAIIVAIVFHEFSHGVLGATAGLKIKSLGILAFIFPIGAFVEPDEEELKKIERRKRMRVFAAGPSMNLIISVIFILIFSFGLMGSVTVASNGIGVGYIVKDSPAQEIGLDFGSLIQEINSTVITNIDDFFRVMNRTYANETVHIKFYKSGKILERDVVLADKYNFTKREEDRGKGFLGVGVINSFKDELSMLKNPFHHFPGSFLYLYVMPLSAFFNGYTPITEPYIRFYHVNGLFSSSPYLFWSLTNAVYWIFWLNLVVGLFNVLPMIPLDGGYLFQDLFEGILEKFSVKRERRERLTKIIMIGISVFILVLILYPLLVKYIYSFLY